MATGVNNLKPVPSAASASSSVAASATPSVFIPPADHTIGTWLSLGSYEEVFNSDFEYWAVTKVLNMGGMKLVKILKIHNNLLKDRFDEEVNLIKKGRNSGFDPNIQDLYHGTSEHLEKICHEGLDERLSTKGHFGRGIYFSDSPAFCRIHSEEKSPPNPYLVRCRVILGDCKIYPPGSSDPCLTREPVKEVVSGKNVFYDSVQGMPGGFKQYVVYEKRRALIQYVIYYTASGPLPSLPPIPSTTAKSAKKKRPKSKERKSSTSSHNSDSRRHSSMSSGDEKRSQRSGSVSSSEGCAYRKSSDADSVDSDDGATCSGKTSLDITKKDQVLLSQPLTDPVPDVPRVQSTRDRTRRLMSTATATNTASGATSADTGASGTSIGASSAVAGATSAGAGTTSLATADPRTDAYKKKVQENAMKQMLELKDKLTDREMNELFRCYSQTYGGANSPGLQEFVSPGGESSVSSSGAADDVQLIIDTLVEDFRSVVGHVDPAIAREYIIQFNMDVEVAINAYFESI